MVARSSGEDAYERGWLGDFRPSVSPVGAPAWRWALDAQRWFAAPDEGALRTPEALEALDDEPGLAAALMEHGRAAAARLDADALAAFTAVARRRLGGLPLLDAWHALFEDDGARALAVIPKAPSAAPWERIEATSLRALGHAQRGELEEATAAARRAVRMARTEDFPQSQYLASLVLARVRRLAGAPPLAARIMDALAPVAPASWSAWVAWERAMVGLDPGDRPPVGDALRDLLDGAAEGDVARFDRGAAATRDAIAGWPALGAELRAALGVLDLRLAVETLPPTVRPFAEGTDLVVPGVVSGLCAAPRSAPELPPVLLWVAPSGAVRRVAGRARGLAVAVTGSPSDPTTPSRAQIAIAQLAVFGAAGMEMDAFFRAVYGFSFDGELHGGMLRQLTYRMREWLGARGAVERDEDRIRLRLERPLLTNDPRFSESLETRMLSVLARTEHRSARDVAGHLKVPLRTAQRALQRLTEEGWLDVQKSGRSVEYRLEDTTFSEPTRWR